MPKQSNYYTRQRNVCFFLFTFCRTKVQIFTSFFWSWDPDIWAHVFGKPLARPLTEECFLLLFSSAGKKGRVWRLGYPIKMRKRKHLTEKQKTNIHPILVTGGLAQGLHRTRATSSRFLSRTKKRRGYWWWSQFRAVGLKQPVRTYLVWYTRSAILTAADSATYAHRYFAYLTRLAAHSRFEDKLRDTPLVDVRRQYFRPFWQTATLPWHTPNYVTHRL